MTSRISLDSVHYEYMSKGVMRIFYLTISSSFLHPGSIYRNVCVHAVKRTFLLTSHRDIIQVNTLEGNERLRGGLEI